AKSMKSRIAEILDTVAGLASAGYAIGLHVRFAAPTYLFRTYSPEWNEHYSASGLVMQDPVVAWGMTETGAVRWSALKDSDPAGVLTDAEEFGLAYGATVGRLEDGSRTVAGFARPDREFSDLELGQLQSAVAELHELTKEGVRFSSADERTIRTRSVTA
ncbi:MAG: autoinducer binding domain-containing protein, partial [Pseudomonadota bacterium]